MVSPEKVILNFSIKNCQKNYFYVIKVSTLNLSLGQVGEFETEKIECLEDNKEIVFKNNIVYYYHFDKKQKLIIKTIKIIPVNNEYKNKENERHTTLSSLVASPNSTYERPLNKEFPEQDVLCIKLTKINNKKGENDSIFEFIKSGIKLSIFVSMDFSNRKNQQNIKESINNYTKILKGIINQMGIYTDNYKLFYNGYGATLKNFNNSSLLYKSIFDIDISEKDFSKINNKDLDKYIESTIPEIKVCISSLIRKITKKIYELYKTNYYNVLFILAKELTDENDRQETIDAFIESSYLPLTIIIIGEGKNDLSRMNELFGVHIKVSSTGMDKNRDNIIYINFTNDFRDNVNSMIEFCLREICKQIIGFYKLIKCSPQQIKLNNFQSIKESFNKYKSSICLYESKIISSSQMDDLRIKKNNSNEIKSDYGSSNINGTFNYQEIIGEKTNKPLKPNIDKKNIHINGNKQNNMNNPNVIIKRNQKGTKIKNKNKNNDVETPGKYIIPTVKSICSNIDSNPYDYDNNPQNSQINTNPHNNNEKKFTPGNSINNYILNKDNKEYKNNKDYNPYIKNNNNVNNRKNKGIQGNVQKKTNNQDQKPSQEKKIITPGGSICPNINYNPYNQQKGTPEGPQVFIIPEQSVIQDNQTVINPYCGGNNNNSCQNQNKMGNDSGVSKIISTNSSNNNDIINRYNLARMNNYSIDSSQMK